MEFKNFKILILSIAFLGLLFACVAAPIDSSTARTIAGNFLTNQRQTNSSDLQRVYMPSFEDDRQANEDAFFIFSNESAFVIVSADDAAMPVLGYGDNGSFSAADMPIAMAEMLQNYEAQISYIRSNSVQATPEIRQLWQDLAAGRVARNENTRSVSPLVQSNWGQSNPCNLFCPFDQTENERTLVGCAALSMAQVLHYWQFPINGFGSHSYTHSTYGFMSADFANTAYHYSQMPNNVDGSLTQAQQEAICTLTYHCGVSMEMNYGVDASSAFPAGGAPSAEHALKTFFGYLNAHAIRRVFFSSDQQWIDSLKFQLDLERPVLYTGYGNSGGHTFVIDGYENHGYFHVNWGWFGANNGYFAIGSLNPATYTFNESNIAVIDVTPEETPAMFVNRQELTFYHSLEIDSFNVTGMNLTQNIGAKVTGAFALSTDRLSWSDSVSLGSTGGVCYVRYSNNGGLIEQGVVSLTSAAAESRYVLLEGYGNVDTLYVSSAGYGGISPNGMVFVAPNSSQTFTLTPNSAHVVLGVMLDDMMLPCIGNTYTYQSSINGESHSLIAVFREFEPMIVTDADSLVFHCHPYDTTVPQAVATACIEFSSGYIVAVVNDPFEVSLDAQHWSNFVTLNHDTCNIFVRYVPFTVDVNQGRLIIFSTSCNVADTVVLTGVPDRYVISLYSTTGGTIGSGESEVEADYGSTHGFSIIAEEGYFIYSVIVDDEDFGVMDYVEFESIMENHYVYVFFQSALLGTSDYGIEEFNVYPNPADGEVQITLPGEWASCTLTIYDMRGAVVGKMMVNDGERVNLSHLSNGLYFFEMEHQGVKKISKVIKN